MVRIEDGRERPRPSELTNPSQDPFEITPSSLDYEVTGENSGVVVGSIEVGREDMQDDLHVIFEDKRRLRGRLRSLVHSLHNAEKVIFARFNPGDKSLAITVISAAAFAGGMVGIGIRIRRKGERKK